MQPKLQKLLAAAIMTIGSLSASYAQTISTFDDLTLPGTDTAYLETKYPINGDYTFQSGNALFYGNVSFGGYWGNFNYSNGKDTVNISYAATPAAITGSGYNASANYGIAFVPTDYTNVTNPAATIPVGAKLNGTAAGHKVSGVYYTNSVYAYRYIKDTTYHFEAKHYFLKLVMRGYLNGTQSTDSVVTTLADFTGTNTTLVNTWQWANLIPLGDVDSVTFDLISNDTAGGFGINTPAYFAIDNLTTLDGVCPQVTNVTATNILQYNATISWANTVAGIDSSYQIVVDQSATDPSINVTPVNTTALAYAASGLSPNILYYAHVRAGCPDGGFSNWDTVSFKTQQATAINDHYKNELNVVLSPNPAQDIITLNVAIPVAARIYNLEGKLLLTVANAHQINVSGLSAGTYYVQVTGVNDDSKRATLRFIKN
jgi:hypothetical protein